MTTPRFHVPYIDLPGEFSLLQERLEWRFRDVCLRGQYILRDEVTELELRAADYLGVRHAIGVGSGSDALLLSLKALALQPGDEVITVAHTFVATLAAISLCGARPVLVDIDEDHNLNAALLEAAVTPKTKAIVVVHMNGRCCDMAPIRAVCDRHELKLVEDAAQAFGSRYRECHAGNHGHFGCFSFHPMKAFHALGDGGLVTTNDDFLAEQVRLLRNHGQQTKEHIVGYGYNSRLDNLQAAFMLEFFEYLDTWLLHRRAIASRYDQGLADIETITRPAAPGGGDYYDIYSSYVICTPQQAGLREHLLESGIEVFSHWSPPLHRQAALGLGEYNLPVTERISSQVISLPIHPGLSDEQVDSVIAAVNSYDG